MGRRVGMALQERDLTIHLIHPVLHGRRQTCREITRFAIAQHLRQAVIARNHHKGAVLAAVKDIEALMLSSIGKPDIGTACGSSHPGRLGREKLTGHLAGLHFVDKGGLHTADHDHCNGKEEKYSFHISYIPYKKPAKIVIFL